LACGFLAGRFSLIGVSSHNIDLSNPGDTAFDLHITIPDNSPAGQAVQRIVSTEHLTPEQAVTRMLTEAARRHGKKTPAEELIGAFSSLEDAAMIDDTMESARRLRAIDAQRHFVV